MLTEIAENYMENLQNVHAESEIGSRFGKIKINEENRIFFPYGLAGIPDMRYYCIAEKPDDVFKNLPQFKVLQSLENIDLSFIILPIDLDSHLIDNIDIDEACKTLGFENRDDVLMVLITSIHRSPESVKLSVNVRAPLLIDVNNKVAAQYIFMNNKYQVRHMLGK